MRLALGTELTPVLMHDMRREDELKCDAQGAEAWQVISPSDADDDKHMDVDDQRPTGAAEDSENEGVGRQKGSRMVQSSIIGFAKPLNSVSKKGGGKKRRKKLRKKLRKKSEERTTNGFFDTEAGCSASDSSDAEEGNDGSEDSFVTDDDSGAPPSPHEKKKQKWTKRAVGKLKLCAI